MESVCRKRGNTNEIYSGKFCECGNFNCDRSDGLTCGGNGVCKCRVCECSPNYTGSACDCSLDTTSSLAVNGQICMAAASARVVPVSVQTPGSKDQPVRCVRPALESVLSIKSVFSAEPSVKENRKTHVLKNVHIST